MKVDQEFCYSDLDTKNIVEVSKTKNALQRQLSRTVQNCNDLAVFCFSPLNVVHWSDSVTLSSPAGTDWELCFTSACCAKDVSAGRARYRCLRVREDGSDVVALAAFNIQEEAVRRLYKFLKFVHVFFCDRVRIQKVHFHFANINNKHSP